MTATRAPAQRQTTEAATSPRKDATERSLVGAEAFLTPRICIPASKEVRRRTEGGSKVRGSRLSKGERERRDREQVVLAEVAASVQRPDCSVRSESSQLGPPQ